MKNETSATAGTAKYRKRKPFATKIQRSPEKLDNPLGFFGFFVS
jgi:hypothetical protein